MIGAAGPPWRGTALGLGVATSVREWSDGPEEFPFGLPRISVGQSPGTGFLSISPSEFWGPPSVRGNAGAGGGAPPCGKRLREVRNLVQLYRKSIGAAVVGSLRDHLDRGGWRVDLDRPT